MRDDFAWLPSRSSAFMRHAAGIRVHWSKRFPSGTRFRVLAIRSRRVWLRFAETCYMPKYRGGAEWSAPGAANYLLPEYAAENPERLSAHGAVTILTACHTRSGRRLIVDGCHRAAAIQSSATTPLPRVTIVECYGPNVDETFPCDHIA